MDKQYLVALDQGTTSSRAIVFTLEGRLVASAAFEFAQHYPQPGWVEHEPEDLVKSQVMALQEAIKKAGIKPRQVAAMGLANQRETTLLWERASGKPVGRAIVWQCRRTAPLIEQLRRDGMEQAVKEKTGLVPDAYFSATKLRWLLDQPGLQARAEKGELCFGTVDSFLAFRLLKDQPHVTDATNASRTMLFNLHTQDWDEELLQYFRIPRAVLPRVMDSAAPFGVLHPSVLGEEVPLCAMAGDQHAALFGQGCVAPGEVKNTYGTGCFMLMNTGERPVKNEQGLLTTMAWRLDGQAVFALEGSVFAAGALIQWLRDGLGVLKSSQESEALAQSVPDAGGVSLVPAFTGLGAPHWNMYARGTLLGLTRGTGRGHLARAALEAIAFQSDDLLGLLAKALGHSPQSLKVDGGASQNNLLMQIQADVSGIRVLRPQIAETTALGVALLAGIGARVYTGVSDALSHLPEIKAFAPAINAEIRAEMKEGWERAVRATLFDAKNREDVCS